MARRMKRKTRRAIFNTLYTDISTWLQKVAELTNNWRRPITRWPFLRTGIYNYDKPKTKKAAEEGPKLKGVDVVRLEVKDDHARIIVRKEQLCIASLVWDKASNRYVLIVHSTINQQDKSVRIVHKTWFLFYMARRALIHALTQRGIAAGGYRKVSDDPDNIEVIYDGLRVIYGGSAAKPEPKSSWLRFVKIKALAGKLLYSLIKNPEKRKRAMDRVDKFITTIQKLITSNA